ncbi:MAG TPA: MMPL family transporter [Humisphaera sp.]
MLHRLLTFPARRPFATLALAAVALAVAAVGVTRIRADSSLATMFPRDNPSAGALVRVLDRFPTAGELILLATVPEQPGQTPEQSAERAVAFAKRFRDEVERSPDAKALTAGVSYEADVSAYERFAREEVVPAGLFYLDDASYAELRDRRLTRAGMRDAIDQTYSRLAQGGPGSSAMKVLARDPLSLRDFMMSRLVPRRPINTFGNGTAYVSPDGRAVLVRITGTRPASDLEYCDQLMRAMTAAADRANAGDPGGKLAVRFTGAFAAADFSHQQIRHDSIVSIVTTCVLLQGLFLLFYRRPFRQFLLEITPVALGVFVGFGLYGWVRGTVSPVSAVIGGILAGMAVDYSVLYLAAYFRHVKDGHSPREAVALTAGRTVGPMFAAWLTSAVGFLAIAWSSVPTLRDFALLGAICLGSAFAMVVLVLPAAVTLYDARRLAKRDTPADRALPFRFSVERVLGLVERRRSALLGASLVVLAVCAVVAVTRPGGMLPLEQDLHVMHPQPNPALATQKELAERFGADPAAGLMVYLKAETPDGLVTLAHEVDRRLARPRVRSAGVNGSLGLAAALPDPAVVAKRRGAFGPAEVERVLADLDAELADRGFDPAAKAFVDYKAFLRTALTRTDAPTLASLAAHPQVAGNVLPQPPRAGQPAAGPAYEALTLVSVERATDRREARDAMVSAARAALADLPGATLTGLPVISFDTERAVRRDLPLLLGIAGAVVVAYLLAYYRSVADAALALTPTAFSLVVLAAVARVTDQQLNLVNLVALPLLVGIDVDYGIYLVSLARRRRPGPSDNAHADDARPLLSRIAASAQAVIVCAAASAMGFGSLVSVSVPAVRSLGFVVAVGVVSCVVGTFCLLAPILIWRDGRRGRGTVG